MSDPLPPAPRQPGPSQPGPPQLAASQPPTAPSSIPRPREIVLEKAEVMSPTVRGMMFRVTDGASFCFEPGQWVSLMMPAVPTPLIRAYSIASPPRPDNTFDLAITRVSGEGAAEYLYGLAPGDRLKFTGPFGTFTLRQPVTRPVYLVATGTGVAPFRSMLFDLLERGGTRVPITLVFGARTERDILYRKEFEGWERRHSNFSFIPSLSQPGPDWKAARGHVQVTCEKLLRPVKDADVYVCGVRKMVDDLRRHLREWGYAAKQIHYERYD